MSATLGEVLVFDVTAGQTGFFQFLNCAGHIFRATKTGVGIDNRRDIHRLCDIACQLHDFGQGQ